MTKLTYKVNGEEFTSYQAAVAAAGTKNRITRVYTLVPEIGNLDKKEAERRDKRIGKRGVKNA